MTWAGFPGGSEVKVSASNVGDPGSISGSGRSPGEGNGNPLQYSCLENPMDGGAWWAIVHGVTKRCNFHFHGPNIPGFYAILFFTVSDITFTTRHVHSWALFLLCSASSFLLELFLHSSPAAYWAPTNLGSSSFGVISLPFHTVRGVLKARMLR